MYEEIKGVLFDLDGTVYYGDKLIDGADKVINRFKEQGKTVLFMTNNSAKSKERIYEKLIGMGIKCKTEDVYTSGYAAVYYSKLKGYDNVYVFGTDELREEFLKHGIRHSEQADIIVVGFDTEFNYEKLTMALEAALNAKYIIACNLEKNYPGNNAKRMPGCGAMVGALEGALGRKADYIVGKPSPLLLDIICREQGFAKNELLVIGDTFSSDIEMADKYGCKSIYIGNEQHKNTTTVSKIREILNLLD